MTFRTGILGAIFFLAAGLALAQTKPTPGVNADAATASDFEKKVADYMKVHQQAQNGLSTPKPTDLPAKIAEYQHQLAAKIHSLRSDAKQGEIFTPEITGLFQHLLASAMNSPDGAKIRRSYQHAEPNAIRGVKLDVNQEYPDGLPLQSMPPSLLLNLPQLPKELEYRFVGRELVLRDVPANLIADLIPDAITPEKR